MGRRASIGVWIFTFHALVLKLQPFKECDFIFPGSPCMPCRYGDMHAVQKCHAATLYRDQLNYHRKWQRHKFVWPVHQPRNSKWPVISDCFSENSLFALLLTVAFVPNPHVYWSNFCHFLDQLSKKTLVGYSVYSYEYDVCLSTRNEFRVLGNGTCVHQISKHQQINRLDPGELYRYIRIYIAVNGDHLCRCKTVRKMTL